MHPIFTHFDLLHHVARDLNPKDWLNILHVSRLFFVIAAPLVWRKVEGVHNLLALLPNTNIRLSAKHPQQVEHMHLGYSKSQNLTRFKLYAPFVKSLEIYGEHSQDYEVKGWQILAQYAKDGTLLPNILQLTLTAPFPIKSRYQMLWIRTFLAPSILDVRVIKQPGVEIPLMHLPTAVCLLTHVSKVALKIQHLSLFIEEERTDRPEEDSDMIGFWELPLSNCFDNLPTLRAITSTETILGVDVLRAVSGLAELKVLDIWVHGGFTAIWDSLDPKGFPSNPFVALEHLSIRGMVIDEIWVVLGHPVFGNLSSLRLSFHQWPESEEEDNDEPLEYQLIELIARASPRLTTLNIEFDATGAREPRDLLDPASNGGSALLSMSKLPLETVHISSAILGYYNPDSIRSDHLKLAWPLVTKLSMPRQLAGFKELYKFSQLPNLQELILRLNLEEDSLEDNFFERCVGSSSLHTLGGSIMMWPSETEPDISARAILHCWPNLERVVFHIGADDPPHDDDYEDLISDIDEINEELQKLRVSQRGASTSAKMQVD